MLPDGITILVNHNVGFCLRKDKDVWPLSYESIIQSLFMWLVKRQFLWEETNIVTIKITVYFHLALVKTEPVKCGTTLYLTVCSLAEIKRYKSRIRTCHYVSVWLRTNSSGWQLFNSLIDFNEIIWGTMYVHDQCTINQTPTL